MCTAKYVVEYITSLRNANKLTIRFYKIATLIVAFKEKQNIRRHMFRNRKKWFSLNLHALRLGIINMIVRHTGSACGSVIPNHSVFRAPLETGQLPGFVVSNNVYMCYKLNS